MLVVGIAQLAAMGTHRAGITQSDRLGKADKEGREKRARLALRRPSSLDFFEHSPVVARQPLNSNTAT
jgi:hypothetical protein